jgi:D-xylose transport system substrate-binding protein
MSSFYFSLSRQRWSVIALLGLLALLPALAGCVSSGASVAAGCKKIGILMPSKTTVRWEAHDHPLLVQDITQALPGAQIDYYNAADTAVTQQTQADDALNNGDCMLVVAAVDSTLDAPIVRKASAKNVPVIAYDRLIQNNSLAYYVSFDGVQVGELQGQYIVDHHRSGDNVIMINGSQQDNNALLFQQGVLNKILPLVETNELHLLYSTFTPDWSPTLAQVEATDALALAHNDIQIAYVANDDMANTVIAQLKTLGLNGKVVVTGQDATVTGIRNILLGDQSMTVYKAISKEAKATAQLVAALSNGANAGALITGQTKNQFGTKIPSILETPVAVTKSNIRETVLADGFVTQDEICSGLPAGLDTSGVCS